jgi:arsenate reductase
LLARWRHAHDHHCMLLAHNDWASGKANVEMTKGLWRPLTAEFLGSALLAAIVIGSGIAAQQLSPGNLGLELFQNAAATAAGLYAIILIFGPISGAHFNPVVSFVDAAFGGLTWLRATAYLSVQVVGCIAGAVLANLMFSKAAVSISTHDRSSGGHFLSEVVATLGLMLVIFSLVRSGRSRLAPAAVGAYIGAAYFFTSSTSFANPAITVGRMFSNTFAGIAPTSVPSFVLAQAIGGILAFVLIKILYPGLTPDEAANAVVPHETGSPGRVVGGGPRMDATSARHPDTAPGQGRVASRRPMVLFLCTHNAGRSLAARVLLDHYAQGRIDVRSAGSEPADSLNPSVVFLLGERGLDPGRDFPKPLASETALAADVIVTMGCGDTCPVYVGKRYLDWELEDPAGKPIDAVRPIVDEIDRRVQALLAELLTSNPA